jgi:hypothetical protein
MKSRTLWWTARIVVILVLAVASGALTSAQDPKPVRFRGVINDYSPSNVKPTGPWEIRGLWSLTLKGESGKADFSAAVTMELSDFSRNLSNVDTPSLRGQHTHHITVEDGIVTFLPDGGFEVTGPVTITKDGSPAPLAASTLVIDITGGTIVEFSNITLTFQDDAPGGATIHFGPQAIHGVVRKVELEEHRR